MKFSKKSIIRIVVVMLLSFVVLGGRWFMESYGPDQNAMAALNSDSLVKVENNQDYISFYPVSETEKNNPGVLFYPGAKVKPEAYSVLGRGLAEKGIPFVVAKMPVNFAVFDPGKAETLTNVLKLTPEWAIAGHSLGGSMAAKYLFDHKGAFKKLVLLASYPAQSNTLVDRSVQVLSIWGSLDAFVTKEKLEAHKPFLPIDTAYLEIPEGNHSQFGNYGFQKGDNKALISPEEQMKMIVDEIVAFMKK